MDHAWGARSDCHGDLPHSPTHYLKKIYVDSVVFTAHQLVGLIKAFGADDVHIGTDYPFDMAEADPLGHLATVPALPDATLTAIAGENAKRLYLVSEGSTLSSAQ